MLDLRPGQLEQETNTPSQTVGFTGARSTLSSEGTRRDLGASCTSCGEECLRRYEPERGSASTYIIQAPRMRRITFSKLAPSRHQVKSLELAIDR